MLRLHGEMASMVRVHVVRLTVAFGVSQETQGAVQGAQATKQGWAAYQSHVAMGQAVHH